MERIGNAEMKRPKSAKPQVGVIMGSKSDDRVMNEACLALKRFGILFEKKVTSAHRTPKEMIQYALTARQRGIKVIIAGAGGAAHLPGMVASLTELPVIGVPVTSSKLNGLDSLLSIVQMPKGVPVATVAVEQAYNAGILAAQILGKFKEVSQYKSELKNSVLKDQFR